MKNVVLSLALCSALLASDELLPQKQELLEHKREQIEAQNRALRYDWLSPVQLGASYRRDKSIAGEWETSQSLSASYSQDVFRSGGIYYAIEYADAKLGVERLDLQSEASGYAEAVVTTALAIRRDRLKLRQSELLLENSDIEIFLKRNQYDAGEIDITQLNNAIMDKNSQLKSQIALKYAIANSELELAKYTGFKEAELSLPRFSRLEREAYLERNRAIERARLNATMQRRAYDVTYASYLPTLSLSAQAAYGDYESRDGTSYGYGATLSMPIDFMRSTSLESSRAGELVARSEALDLALESALSFRQAETAIAQYEELISVTRSNLSLYDDLIEATKAGVESGYKSGYDLQTLQNSRRIDELEIEINQQNIQLELAALHFALEKE